MSTYNNNHYTDIRHISRPVSKYPPSLANNELPSLQPGLDRTRIVTQHGMTGRTTTTTNGMATKSPMAGVSKEVAAMTKRRNYDNIKAEIVPHYIPQEEMTDLIILALFGCSPQETAKKLCMNSQPKKQKGNKEELTASVSSIHLTSFARCALHLAGQGRIAYHV